MAYLYKEANPRVKIHSSSFYLEQDFLNSLDAMANYFGTSRAVFVEGVLKLAFKSYFDEEVFYEEFERKKAKKKIFNAKKHHKKAKQSKQGTKLV